MCTISMIGDHYAEKWAPMVTPNTTTHIFFPYVAREEFDALKREVEDMKALLVRAKKYDEDKGEPGCQMEEKLVVLRKVAELVGVDLEDVLGGG